MAMTRKIIVAGPLVREALYPRINKSDNDKVRNAKRKATGAAQQRLNDKLCWMKCEGILAANFIKGDVVGCLTFADDKLPRTREQVRRSVGQFRAELEKTFARKKKTLRMVWCIEHIHGEGRWHVHFVCSSTDYKTIVSCWRRGAVELSALRNDKDKNYESLARYMCKEQRDKVGQRAFSYTRSCQKPTVETWTVPDDTQLSEPKGAMIFEHVRDKTEYGRFEYLKYSYPEAIRHRHSHRRR